MVVAYKAGGVFHILKMCQLKGSVFPKAFMIAMPAAIFATLLKVAIDLDILTDFKDQHSILKEPQIWSGYTFLVGFLIVFRSHQAYNRFWDGCTNTHEMRAEWFDACSALVAFCKHSQADESLVWRFKHILIRLFSMLHASALAELEEINCDLEDICELKAFNLDLIDPDSIDKQSLKSLQFSTSKVELIFTWVQMLIVDNISTGVLNIPPPILSRAFQEIANGMVAFHNAIKITYVPFPFPYAQTCDFLLILHWVMVPIVCSQWVTSPFWVAVFVLIQVFVLWCLNLIAVEIENPFGQDDNDLSGHYMQIEMNRHLLLLLQPETTRTPQLIGEDAGPGSADIEIKCFNDVWQDIRDRPTENAQAPHIRTARRHALNFTNCHNKLEKEENAKHRGTKRSVNSRKMSFADMPLDLDGMPAATLDSRAGSHQYRSTQGTMFTDRSSSRSNLSETWSGHARSRPVAEHKQSVNESSLRVETTHSVKYDLEAGGIDI